MGKLFAPRICSLLLIANCTGRSQVISCVSKLIATRVRRQTTELLSTVAFFTISTYSECEKSKFQSMLSKSKKLSLLLPGSQLVINLPSFMAKTQGYQQASTKLKKRLNA